MKKFNLKKIGLIFMVCLSIYSISALAWGPDIPIWTEGTINCFDVDYAMDGTMFVAFQVEGEDKIRIYQSKDHGFSWTEMNPITNPWVGTQTIPSNILRLKLIVDEDKNELKVFHLDGEGYLYMHQYYLSYWSFSGHRLSDTPIIETSFDVTFNPPTFYVVWLEDAGTGRKKIRIFRSSLVCGADGCKEEISQCYSQTFDWTEAEGKRASIAWGPPNNLYVAYSGHTATGSAIYLLKSNDWGSTWTQQELKPNNYPKYDPRVAAANVDNSGAWILYNVDRGGAQVSRRIDLQMCYISEQYPPSYTDISQHVYIDEYIADIKYYKGYPNQYINMVYIYDEEATYRRAYWAWTSQSDPLNWHDITEVNDQDITSWPEDVAPRIVYSPGVWAGGGGVVFSYYGKKGLYFDAPWNTISGALLIVTAEEFWNPLQRLVDWKNSTGIPTYIVSWERLTYGRDFAERIKYSIDYYYREHGVRYVMLVGDSEKLPVRYTFRAYEEGKPFMTEYLNKPDWGWNWCNGGDWHDGMSDFVNNFTLTDLYYADLYDSSGQFETWDSNGNDYFGEIYRDNLNPEGIDYIPDVAVGRVPASTVEQVENYVDKVIAYESCAWNSDWFKRALVIAKDERIEPDGKKPNWVSAGEQTSDIMQSAGFDTELVITHNIKMDDDIYKEPGDDYIRAGLQEGIGFLYYMDHGPWGMGQWTRDWEDVQSGQNKPMFPIVFHGGCLAGEFGPSSLMFDGYKDIYGISHAGFKAGEHFDCYSWPPQPATIQDKEREGSYPEFLICKCPHCGAIAYYACSRASQEPSYDLGKWLFEAYTHGHRLIGDMWREAVTNYYNEHAAKTVPEWRYEKIKINEDETRTERIRYWYPVAKFFMFQKFVLFGDPSLRVGGIPGYQMPVPNSPNFIYYDPVSAPVINKDPFLARPFSFGDMTTGTATVRVALPTFSGPVDIYVAIALPDGNIYLFDSNNNLVLFTDLASIVPWRTEQVEPLDQVIFTGDVASLLPGDYWGYILVVPANTDLNTFSWSTSPYYLWYFKVTLPAS